MPKKIMVTEGKRYIGEMPFSEVMYSMRIAEKRMQFELITRVSPGGDVPFTRPEVTHHVVQLYENGRHYAAPVLPGEAGLFWDPVARAYFGYDLEEIDAPPVTRRDTPRSMKAVR